MEKSVDLPVKELPKNLKIVIYSKDKLDFFKKIIEKKLESAQKELDILKNEISKKNSNGTDDTYARHQTVEEASTVIDIVVVTHQINSLNLFIRSLKFALQRISNKTYGICSETGQLICEERLILVPHATLSIEGKKIRDAKNKIRY